MDFIVVIQREGEYDHSWKRKVSLMEATERQVPFYHRHRKMQTSHVMQVDHNRSELAHATVALTRK